MSTKDDETSAAEAAEPAEASEPGDATKVDFGTFVLSLATNAMASLSPDGDDDRVPGGKVSLEHAAQYIDILVMLEAKTAGNLDEQEKELLQSVLYDLRMRYLEAARA